MVSSIFPAASLLDVSPREHKTADASCNDPFSPRSWVKSDENADLAISHERKNFLPQETLWSITAWLTHFTGQNG